MTLRGAIGSAISVIGLVRYSFFSYTFKFRDIQMQQWSAIGKYGRFITAPKSN